MCLSGVKMSITRNAVFFVISEFPQELTYGGKQQVFSAATLRYDECVRTLELEQPTVNKSPFFLCKIDFIEELIDILFVSLYKFQNLFFLVPTLKSIANG